MKAENKAFALNFLCFAVLFLVMRYALVLLFNLTSLFGGVLAAVLASILAPKFKVIKQNKTSKMYISWFFKKGKPL